MKRSLLAGVGAAAACGVVLYLLVGGHDDTTSSAQAPVDRPVRDVPATPTAPTRAPAPTIARDVPPDPTAPTAPTMEYQREDGSLVRDHRSPDLAGTWIRPALPYPTQSPVTPAVVQAVMGQVRPLVLKCLDQVPESAYGQQPVVMTRVKLQIDDKGNLSVLELGPATDQIDESAVAPALDCIKQHAGDVHAHVDNPAVPDATIAVTIKPLDYGRQK